MADYQPREIVRVSPSISITTTISGKKVLLGALSHNAAIFRRLPATVALLALSRP
jgi:hypothetical protein